jgi:hypothetical protein
VTSNSGLVTVNVGAADIIVAKHQAQGWLIFRLPRFIASKEQFFAGAREVPPLDPALQRGTEPRCAVSCGSCMPI